MSEAYGNILLKASSEIKSELLESDEFIKRKSVASLLIAAGIDTTKLPKGILCSLAIPEIGTSGEYIAICIFGDSWIPVLHILTTQGSKVEVYGSVLHEHGVRYFFSLNSNGDRYYEKIDYESNINSNREQEIIGLWHNTVDSDFLDAHPDVFDLYDEEDDDEDDDDDGVWLPTVDKDFYHDGKDGHRIVSTGILWPHTYSRERLERAHELGASIANKSTDGMGELFPFSALAEVIASSEIPDSFKEEVCRDILDIFEIDTIRMFCSHSSQHGTYIELCERNNLHNIADLIRAKKNA